VERVRAEALSMRSTGDLRKVAAVLFREMRNLGFETPTGHIEFVDETSGQQRGIIAYENPRQYGCTWTTPTLVEFDQHIVTADIDLNNPEWVRYIRDVREQGEVTVRTMSWTLEGLVSTHRNLGMEPSAAYLELLKQAIGDWQVVFVPGPYGAIGFRERAVIQEHVEIAKALADAFSLGFLRFRDFQRLEEGNTALSSANKELFAVNKELQQTLSDKEKAQEALVRSESMAAIGTLVAGVAHELNNPLGAAYSLVQTVQEMVEEDTAEQLQQEKEEIVGHLTFSRKELNRAKEIVAALLGLSRQNQDYAEAVELNTVVQDALRVLYNQYKKYDLNLVEEYGEGLPSVQGNFAQLGQVCMNLIKNAIEALKGVEGQIVLKTYAVDGQVVFECADTGPGIPEEVRQNIFKPFFTTKAPGEGTGLGLYICHQTIEKHRGSIEMESEVGKGTRFRVRLPAG
jgi:signal transduction histidine kinase